MSSMYFLFVIFEIYLKILLTCVTFQSWSHFIGSLREKGAEKLLVIALDSLQKATFFPMALW